MKLHNPIEGHKPHLYYRSDPLWKIVLK